MEDYADDAAMLLESVFPQRPLLTLGGVRFRLK